MYAYGTLRTYIEAASSGESTPGGGSIAACAGALGMSMACMSANFTLGKKKYADVEAEVRGILAACAKARDELLSLVDEDVEGYGSVSVAYGLPRCSDDEKAARAEAIQKSLVIAMGTPLRVLRATRQALATLVRLVEIGNRNLISDVGVAALMAEAALRAAKLNVEINLKFLKDEVLVEATRTEIVEAAAEAAANAKVVMDKTVEEIGGTL